VGDFQHKHSLVFFKNTNFNINKHISSGLKNINSLYPLPRIFFDRQVHRCSHLCLNKDGKCSEHYPNKIHDCNVSKHMNKIIVYIFNKVSKKKKF